MCDDMVAIIEEQAYQDARDYLISQTLMQVRFLIWLGFSCEGWEELGGDREVSRKTWEQLGVHWYPITKTGSWSIRTRYYLENRMRMMAFHAAIQKRLVAKGYRWGVVPGSSGSEFYFTKR